MLKWFKSLWGKIFKKGKKVKSAKTELRPDKIVTNQKFLRMPCRETNLKELERINFKERAKLALRYTWTRGYGLAANQIGMQLKAAYYGIKYKDRIVERILFNAEIIKAEGVWYFDNEGCLSIPNKRMRTKRFKKVTVKNGDGEIIEADGIEAAVLQHEIDHMNGVLCIDHAVEKDAVPGRNDLCPCNSGRKYKKCCL